MKSYQGTICQLTEIELDILKQSKASPFFAYANKEIGERFYLGNQEMLAFYKEQMEALSASFLKKDEQGEIILTKNADTGKMEYSFISDEAEKAYRAEMKALGQTKINIYY